MAEKRRRYIFFSFILNALSVLLIVISLVTDSWIRTDMQAAGDSQASSLNYGLYGGEMTLRVVVTPSLQNLYMTCVASVSSCALTCKTTAEARTEEVINLAAGLRPASLVCDANSNVNQLQPNLDQQPVISYAFYICLNLFLYLQLVLAVSAMMLSILNMFRNPTEPLLGLQGVEISSGTSAVAGAVVIFMWGIYFATSLNDHLAFSYIAAQTIDFDPVLGFSYWILLPAVLCSLCSLGMIELRRYLLEREPPDTTIQIETNSDGTIFLY